MTHNFYFTSCLVVNMWALYLLLVALVYPIGASTEISPCGVNENNVSCKTSCSDSYCPKSEKDTQARLCTQVCRGPGCVCQINHRRAANGTCIPTRDCPPFDCSARPNEVYDACPPYCPTDSCLDASPSGKCRIFGRIGILLICNPKCRCKKGYWRNDKGICVPYEKCPNICPINEEYVNCTQYLCRTQNCSQRFDDYVCRGDLSKCTGGCVCKEGYLRAKNGTCVKKDNCDVSFNPCGDHERWVGCANSCTESYCPTKPADTEPRYCTADCRGPACNCEPNYSRVKNGTCIPTSSCPSFCPKNEEFNDCIQKICRPLNCTQKDQAFVCLNETYGRCKSDCVCKAGYLRDENGACVLEDKCKAAPKPSPCTDSEVQLQCTNDCTDQKCPKTEEDTLPQFCFESCKGPGCVCGFNYRRSDNGSCIPTRQCPPINCSSRPNEVFDPCPPYCPSDSCRDASPTGKCPVFGNIGIELECNPQCRCAKGYWRNDDGICIPYAQCPNVCPVNEEYVNCTQYLCRTQNCSQRFDDYVCRGDLSKCTDGCVCKEGYLRAKNGTCVEQDKCDVSFNPCGTHESLNSCANSCTERSCPITEADTKPKYCTADCRGPACNCDFNYSRAKNGTCIPTRDCPPINCSARPNEVFDSCPPYCPSDSCRDATPTGKCPELGVIGVELECSPKCRCAKGYWRNDDGICIPYAQCPNICPINEEYVNCTQYLCRTQNCSQRFDDYVCRGDLSKCTGGCVCKEGYLRNKNGTCVEKDKCDVSFNPCGTHESLNSCANSCTERSCPINEADIKPKYCTADCRGPACNCDFNYSRAKNGTCIPTRDCPPFDCSARPNEVYDSCPPGCPSDSCYDATPSGKCPLPGRIGITLECNPKCRCIKGYWRNNKGICVPYEKCPGICPKNEIYTDCAQRLCRPMNCTDFSDYREIFTCEPDKVEGCQKGCVCKEGFLRASNGTCVPDTQCDPKTNECSDPNEEYTDCKRTCPGDTCGALTSKFPCEDDCCEPGCACKSGYRRQTASGPCIPVCKCKEMSTAPMCQKQPQETSSP